MRVSLDDVYDELLQAELSSRGKHVRRSADSGHAVVTTTALDENGASQGLQVAEAEAGETGGAGGAGGANGVDGATVAPTHARAPAPIHEAFESPPPAERADRPLAKVAGLKGRARYRSAAMVGAGGLACAAVGAFLGGLGGSFTVNPAAAHPLASSPAPEQTAAATNQVNDALSTESGSSALTAASYSALPGPLTQGQGSGPLQWLTAGSGSRPLAAVTGAGGDVPGGATGDGESDGNGTGSGVGAGCIATTADLGLGCVLGSLTTTLGRGSLPADPSLAGMITIMSGELANLSSLLPVASRPLPPGGLSAAGIPGLVALLATGAPGAPGVGDVATLLGGATGSIAPSLTALPVGSGGSGSGVGGVTIAGTSVPGLPGASSGGSAATPPTTSVTSRSTSGTTTTTSTTTTTTMPVTIPLPLPLPAGAGAGAGERSPRLGGRRRGTEQRRIRLGADAHSPLGVGSRDRR